MADSRSSAVDSVPHLSQQVDTSAPIENEKSQESAVVDDAIEPERTRRRGLRFWLVFVALCCSLLLSALDLGGVGTAAPTIVHALNGTDFTWVGSAYSLAAAACLPMSGNLAQIFGRRPVLLASLVLFAVGSAVSASANSMSTLIGGRAIQGVGGGGIQSLVAVITADITSLRERGLFTGITGMLWTLGSVVGPFINGALAERASWRWIFYLNLPLCGLAFGVVLLFLDLPVPEDKFWLKFLQVDWLGNLLIVTSTTSCILGLTWGGAHFAWSSPKVLAPLVIGIVGLAVSLYYEFTWPSKPTIPKSVFYTRTSFAGLLATFLHGVVGISVAFYLPMWFQSVRSASPIVSGLLFLPMAATISPSAIIEGIVISRTGKYRLVTLVGWCFMLLGVGLLISIRTTTSIGILVLYQLIQGFGMGLLYSTTFMVLAPLSVTENAAAVSLLTFIRTFSQAWGISITGTILQNELARKLPAQVLANLSHSGDLAYNIIPLIATMSQPLKGQVEEAFLQSMHLVWIVMEAVCAVGFFTVFATEDIPLHRKTDEGWDIKEKARGQQEASVH